MGGIELAVLILGGFVKGADLIQQAILAFQQKDEAKGLALLDQAISEGEAAMPMVRSELVKVREVVATAMAAKFPGKEPGFVESMGRFDVDKVIDPNKDGSSR
jgi:hypothetical protein